MPDMPVKECACGTPMDNVHGIWICQHCDMGCKPSLPCILCARYSGNTQRRINTTNLNEPLPKSGNPVPDPRDKTNGNA